jgi:hypothetical protein
VERPCMAEVGPPVILSLGVAGYCSVSRHVGALSSPFPSGEALGGPARETAVLRSRPMNASGAYAFVQVEVSTLRPAHSPVIPCSRASVRWPFSRRLCRAAR